MSDDLRKKIIRLAHERPELRGDLLPLLAGPRVAYGKPADLIVNGPFRKVWREWFQRTKFTLFGHGSELVKALGAAGLTDNVARAESVLRYATEQGWLTRGKNTPTREQQFFDVNRGNQRQGWVTSGYEPGPKADEAIL